MSLSPIIERIILILSGRVAGATTPLAPDSTASRAILSASGAMNCSAPGWLISVTTNRSAPKRDYGVGACTQHRFAYQAVGIGSISDLQVGDDRGDGADLLHYPQAGMEDEWIADLDGIEVINELLG